MGNVCAACAQRVDTPDAKDNEVLAREFRYIVSTAVGHTVAQPVEVSLFGDIRMCASWYLGTTDVSAAWRSLAGTPYREGWKPCPSIGRGGVSPGKEKTNPISDAITSVLACIT